jgi:hypothetical protein
MHTCLTLSNIGGQCYVERAISELIRSLDARCDSIRSCDISVEGPTGEGDARFWRVALKVRVFDETVRATARAPEGTDAQQSLSRLLAEIYTRARVQLDHISDLHHSCCGRGGEDISLRPKACA